MKDRASVMVYIVQGSHVGKTTFRLQRRSQSQSLGTLLFCKLHSCVKLFSAYTTETVETGLSPDAVFPLNLAPSTKK